MFPSYSKPNSHLFTEENHPNIFNLFLLHKTKINLKHIL